MLSTAIDRSKVLGWCRDDSRAESLGKSLMCSCSHPNLPMIWPKKCYMTSLDKFPYLNVPLNPCLVKCATKGILN